MGEGTADSEMSTTNEDDELKELLTLARNLADRLAYTRPPVDSTEPQSTPHPGPAKAAPDEGYSLRLSHALTLDIVDVLEGARSSRP